MYYASIGMLSIVVHCIINFEALKKPNNKNNMITRSRYRKFLFGVMLYYVSDILWGILYDQKWILFAYIDTFMYFFSMVLSVLLWTRFVIAYLNNSGRFSKILIYSGWIIFLYEIIALIINFFIPVVFAFGKDGQYQPGQARYITLFIQMILFLMISFYTLYTSVKVKGNDRFHHRTIGFSGIIMTIFIALQAQYPLLPFYAIGCLLATCLIHSFVYKDETISYNRKIEYEKEMAHKDALTGVRNKLAYIDYLKSIEYRSENGALKEYGVIVFDLNDLKKVNDNKGHAEGDEYIKSACKMICQRFKHSPVFRIGGDEFVVILEGEDYESRDSLIQAFEYEVEENQKNGLVVVSSGLDVFNPDIEEDYNDVFKRADKKMYERKKLLKEMKSI